MIRRRDNPKIVITQTAHSWLAGQLAMQWGNQAFSLPALPQEVMLAASNHDNGWALWEQTPKLDADFRPLDFLNMPPTAHAEIWRRSVYGLAAQTPYAALLVSRHGRHLVTGRLHGNAQDSAADKTLLETLCNELEIWENQTLVQLNQYTHFKEACTLEVIAANFRLLQVFDQLSLLLCMNTLSETVIHQVPTVQLSERTTITLMPKSVHEFTINPWPFQQPEFSLSVQARILPQQVFKNEPQFQTIWIKTPLEPLIFRATQ